VAIRVKDLKEIPAGAESTGGMVTDDAWRMATTR